MKLLLRYAAEKTGRPVVKLDVGDITSDLVVNFLAYLESERGNQIASRNNRLAALRTFFAYVAFEEPTLAEHCRRVCAIPLKRGPTRAVPYLEQEEMDALLGAPDRKTRIGRAHYAMLLFLYNVGARAAEVIDVRVRDLRLDGEHCQVLLHGKGNKERICPIWKDTTAIIREHLAERGGVADDQRIFVNRLGQPLTRHGIHYIVDTYAEKAAATAPSIAAKRVSPHTIRHTTAVHLLNSGVDVNVVRVWLGHVNLRTTNIYAEINLATKRRAIEMLAPKSGSKGKTPSWRKSPDILSWLEGM
jgi:site-specific recombinase XerD